MSFWSILLGLLTVISSILGILSFLVLDGKKKLRAFVASVLFTLTFFMGFLLAFGIFGADEANNEPMEERKVLLKDIIIPKPKGDPNSFLIGQEYYKYRELGLDGFERAGGEMICDNTYDLVIEELVKREGDNQTWLFIYSIVIRSSMTKSITYKIQDVLTVSFPKSLNYVSPTTCRLKGLYDPLDCHLIIGFVESQKDVYHFPEGTVQKAWIVTDWEDRFFEIDPSLVSCDWPTGY